MPIIIDGWNLIRNHRSDIDDVDGDSLESAAALINSLHIFQGSHRDPIILVFDSTNEYLDMKYTNTAGLKVVPARNADDYIKRYIDRVPEKQRSNLRVVSSDNDIYFYAKSAYAVPVKSEEFWAKLKKVKP
ncbi:MAG: NYN domain-containing protein [Candidatus Omnitrophica bacterium]|nr:NYN domain-containing protein [Candidatus Omnitrophota bacterium]